MSYFTDVIPIAWIGGIGAVLTTVCWLPQAVRLILHKDTRAISLATNVLFGVGLVFWLAYGVALMDWPLIGSNAVTLALTSVIIGMKLKFG
jgi:MtN3 and saliva related transmembrane protein